MGEYKDVSADCKEGDYTEMDITVNAEESMKSTCSSEKIPHKIDGPHCVRISWCGYKSEFKYGENLESDFETTLSDVLIITSSKLQETSEFRTALNEYRQAIEKDGFNSLYIEVDSDEIKKFGIDPADPTDWKSVKNVINRVVDKTEAKYLLILGGIDVIPMPPAKAKLGEEIGHPATDDRYRVADSQNLAIGRMPSFSGNKINPIIEALKSAVKIHKNPTLTSKIVFWDKCATPPACEWGIKEANYITNILFGKDCKEVEECKQIPPYCADRIHFLDCSKDGEVNNLFSTSDFIYITAHADPYSFVATIKEGLSGFRYLIDQKGLLASKPPALGGNPVIITDTCNSGVIDCEACRTVDCKKTFGCISKRGNAYSFLEKGAGNYIANTRFGWMGLTIKHLGNVILFMRFGDTIGEAMLNMKQKSLALAESDFDRAAIYEIQLYGDPTIRYGNI